MNFLANLSSNLVTVMSQGNGTGTQGIIDAIDQITNSGWDIIKSVSSGVAIVVFAWIFVGMIISSDAQSVARSKKQLLTVGIALIAIQFADQLVSWLVAIASTVSV